MAAPSSPPPSRSPSCPPLRRNHPVPHPRAHVDQCSPSLLSRSLNFIIRRTPLMRLNRGLGSICHLRALIGLGLRSISTCRGVVVKEFGGPEVLEVRQDVRVPDLKDDEVLVRTRAVSINPIDLQVREGLCKLKHTKFLPKHWCELHVPEKERLPLILGRDVSGVVEECGRSAKTSFSVGQEVFGALDPCVGRGTYTDYSIFRVHELQPKPPSMTHVDACAIPYSALTAWRALMETTHIIPGQRVLVVGGGAVCLSAVQLAMDRRCKVETLFGPESCRHISAAGASLAIDKEYKDWEAKIDGLFDVVLDIDEDWRTEDSVVRFLKRGGHYMNLRGHRYISSLCDKYGAQRGIWKFTEAISKKFLEYKRSHDIRYTCVNMVVQDARGLANIRWLAERGRLKIPVARTYPITRAQEAHRAKAELRIPGKVVLEFD